MKKKISISIILALTSSVAIASGFKLTLLDQSKDNHGEIALNYDYW